MLLHTQVIINFLLLHAVDAFSIIESYSEATHTYKKRSPLETIIHITILSKSHPNYGKRVIAIPALFGDSNFTKIVAPVAIGSQESSCSQQFPKLRHLTGSDKKLLEDEGEKSKIVRKGRNARFIAKRKHTDAIKWISATPRGNCPFDMKVYHAQRSGYQAALIYNDGIRTGVYPARRTPEQDWKIDIPIRMTSNTIGNQVEIPSMFLTYSQMRFLLGYNETSGLMSTQVPESFVVSIEYVAWDYFIHGSLTNPSESKLSIVLFYLSLVTLSISVALSLVIVYGLVRNYFTYGTLLIDFNSGKNSQPKMKKVEFPTLIFQAKDVHEHSCCAICIDDFVVGSTARVLPCGHQFHETCVDPWLMQHNRLCPVCKQDVLILSHRQLQIKECDGMCDTTNGNNALSFKQRLARFTQKIWVSRGYRHVPATLENEIHPLDKEDGSN